MSGSVVPGAGVDLAYRESGSGPATVLVHGMAADAACWSLDRYPGRVIAYDRRGYGSSGAPEPYVRTTVHEQAEDLAAVIGGLGAAPALLVGADAGALACLDVLIRHRMLARAAVLVDPPLFAFVPEATEALSTQRAELERALREGGPADAVDRWLPDAADAGRRERARRAAAAFFADFGSLATLALGRRQLREIALPLAVVQSPAASAHVRTAGAALVELVPDARTAASAEQAARELL